MKTINDVFTGQGNISLPLARAHLNERDLSMIYHNHLSYDRAIDAGIRIAEQESDLMRTGARVWYNPFNDNIGACGRTHENFHNSELETVAYCQRWDDTTIQIRRDRGEVTFVKVKSNA